MTIQSDEYKSVVGVDSLYIAAITQDTAAGYVAGTPEYLAPVAELRAEPAVNSETQYADNQAYDTMSSVGETLITAVITNIPAEMYAKITGQVFDSTTGRVYENEGAAPYFAFGFRSLKSNGKYRYYWFPKVKFSLPKEEQSTKADTPEFKTRELLITAIKTVYQFDLGDINDSVKRVWGDEDTTNFSATNWFTTVQVPGVAAVDALALSSSVPADAATGVVVTANLTLTFNNVLTDAAVHNIALFDPSDGSLIAGAITIDATKKIITVNPTASLTAATPYLLTYAVEDIYGQNLAGSVNFTTA
ncbi:MAG: hypothetical protein CVU46_03130 [Chloroflexi bacterium HGW-Chloroflexi-8]|nr:MAG: hypothetical protein CVU46_03130 [Chloroflexi bacterium HGW-Chloroflexi-8]